MMIALPGCGSTYHVSKGGWHMEAVAGGGACLNVHGDGSDILRVCIDKPEPLQLPPATVARICAK